MAQGKGNTYSCDAKGCSQIFTRTRDLKKHKIEHEDPSRLFYCDWLGCRFYSLSSKNLKVHFMTHTGEKIYGCPDTIKVTCPSGLLNGEIRCEYVTNDPSLLSKHRQRKHGYSPPPRARSKHTGTYEFVDCNIQPPPRASKPKQARKRKTAARRSKSTRVTRKTNKVRAQDKALDDSLPSTSQQGANECEQANVESPHANGPSVDFTNTVSVVPDENMASNAHVHTYAEQLAATGSAPPMFWNTPGSSSYMASPHATGPSACSTMPVPSHQGYVPFYPAPYFDWSMFYTQGYTSPFTTGTYGPAPNPEMNSFVMAGSEMYFNPPGYYGWRDESQWGMFHDYNAA